LSPFEPPISKAPAPLTSQSASSGSSSPSAWYSAAIVAPHGWLNFAARILVVGPWDFEDEVTPVWGPAFHALSDCHQRLLRG
jgi:hypothetical protein